MSSISRSIADMVSIDELSFLDSFAHRLHPLAKLITTFFFIIIAVSFPVSNLTGMMPLVLYPVLFGIFSNIPISCALGKLKPLLILLCFVGIWNPLIDKTFVMQLGALTITGGMISFFTLLLKGILALLASFYLFATTGIENICRALTRLHAPALLVTLILTTYRYIGLLFSEAETMTNAYFLRAPGQNGIEFKAWGSFLGRLLIRCYDRARCLSDSMELRGFDGNFVAMKTKKAAFKDYLFTIIVCILLLVIRIINISELIGFVIVNAK